KDATNLAQQEAQAILESRGSTPRLFRNTLVFLVADGVRWQDLDDALRKFLAWDSILAEREVLNLSPFQVKQAETQRQSADQTVDARIPETYCWLLVPEQGKPQEPISWQAFRLSGNDFLAARAYKKLRAEELLLTSFGPTMLRKYLDEVPLWDRDAPHVGLQQLIKYFATYLYLPRLAGPSVLIRAINDGLARLTWAEETFAYAEGYDAANERYVGLVAGQQITLSVESGGML
ncbi:MAG: AAA+ family ATPase, partial [Chloroflexus sp.]